jgi:hypothetical protein
LFLSAVLYGISGVVGMTAKVHMKRGNAAGISTKMTREKYAMRVAAPAALSPHKNGA